MGSGTLQNGSSGRYVYHLQHYLNRYLASRGYAKMTVDGSFGNITKAKVESFQTYWYSKKSIKLDVTVLLALTQEMRWRNMCTHSK